MLITDLALLPGVRVVSRHQLGEVLREQWLQHRGSFEEASSVRLGRLVGARYLLSGLYYLGGDDLVLEVHLLDVEQGSVVRTFRVTGKPTAIPDLELDLASRLGKVFDAEAAGLSQQVESAQVQRDDSPAVQFDPKAIREIQKDLPANAGLHEKESALASTLQTDTILGLERLRHVRDVAANLADDLWSYSLAIRLGAPRYESTPRSGRDPSVLSVDIPVSGTIREETMRQLDPGLKIVEGKTNPEATEIVLGYDESDAGAQQLFRQALQVPRRLFVRAIGGSGEVVAVSSEWSWRMDSYVRVRPDGTVSLPRSHTPFLKGHATFLGSLLTRIDSTISFDAVVVPVPQESRSILVEMVDDGADLEDPLRTNKAIVASLQTSLLHDWAPPVMESIPMSGYLPGNHRQGVALVTGQGGTISEAQLVDIDEEEKFAQSVNDVLKNLPGKCFSLCEKAGPKKPIPRTFTLRIQFELVKDIQNVELSRKVKTGSLSH